MKEIVLTKPPYMNASERRIADMHSLLNILNVLVGELSLLEPSQPELLELSGRLDQQLSEITQQIKEGAEISLLLSRIRESEPELIGYLRAIRSGTDAPGVRAELEASIKNLESVYSVLKVRLEELQFRVEDPDVWVQMEPDVFIRQIKEAFLAIAGNSKGVYGISFNSARVCQEDYLFDLKIDVQPHGEALWMPLRLLDIVRDLTANARKYTPPGGRLALSVFQNGNSLRAIIEDSGCGIPEDELEKVTEFGYRASNVRQRQTMGGGFGLTKAAWLVTSWGGSLHIQSKLEEGTTIRLTIPNTNRPEKPLTWSI